MNRLFYKLRSKTIITFFLGFVLGSIVMLLLMTPSVSPQQKKDAKIFFYSTMYDLFNGMNSPDNNSVSPLAMQTFKEYKARLGGKCIICINQIKPSRYYCTAFFPSGDCFYVEIERQGKRLMLFTFEPENWEGHWSDVLEDIRGP